MAEAVPSDPACGHLERQALVTLPRRTLKPSRAQHNRRAQHNARVNLAVFAGSGSRPRCLQRTAPRPAARTIYSSAPVAKLLYVRRMSRSRVLVSSGSDFEAAVGYSRAVRIGPLVAVSGTTDPGASNGIGAQTREALRRIEIALAEAGATLSDVFRTRIYVIDIAGWREVAAVHAEVFGEIRPAATMVEVAALIQPGLLVEIEADAYSPKAAKAPSTPGR